MTQGRQRRIARIEDSSAPLGFKVAQGFAEPQDPTGAGEITIRTLVRSLAGMQKEALVTQLRPPGSSWRLVCDEGPYLNGTDLAPFPLAFFTVGLADCYFSQVLRYAAVHSLKIDSLEISLDNYYSMKGSFLRGDAVGGAKSAQLGVKVQSDNSVEAISKLLTHSETCSPAHAAMRVPLKNTFSLTFNGRQVGLPLLAPPSSNDITDPITEFDALLPTATASFLEDIITKVEAGETVHNVDGGVASSLKPVQDRELHVQGQTRLTKNNRIKETTIWLLKPIGSTFGFLSDDDETVGGQDLAPSGLAFLAAGIAFCYLTQITRYAHIAKLKLDSVRLVQDTGFALTGSRLDWSLKAAAKPVDTHVFMESKEPEHVGQKVIEMAAQTCFLHAALSGSFPTKIAGALNGVPIRR